MTPGVSTFTQGPASQNQPPGPLSLLPKGGVRACDPHEGPPEGRAPPAALHPPQLEAPGLPVRVGQVWVPCTPPQPPDYHPALAGDQGARGSQPSPAWPRPPDSWAKGGRLFTQDSPAIVGQEDTRKTPPTGCAWRGMAASVWEPTLSSDGLFLSKKNKHALRRHLPLGMRAAEPHRPERLRFPR